jgi:hypothetical protein
MIHDAAPVASHDITEPLLALALVKSMADIVTAVIELGVSPGDAQTLLAHLRTALQCSADACLLVHGGDAAGTIAAGWHEGPPPLSDPQLAAAAVHGAALEHRATGFSVFQRAALCAPELRALGECIDALGDPAVAALAGTPAARPG